MIKRIQPGGRALQQLKEFGYGVTPEMEEIELGGTEIDPAKAAVADPIRLRPALPYDPGGNQYRSHPGGGNEKQGESLSAS